MTAPQNLIKDYRLPKSQSPPRTQAENMFDYVIRDRLLRVERTPVHELDTTSRKLLEEAMVALELWHEGVDRDLAPAEKATYEGLIGRIRSQTERCGSQINDTS